MVFLLHFAFLGAPSPHTQRVGYCISQPTLPSHWPHVLIGVRGRSGEKFWAGKGQVRAWIPALPVPDLPASHHDIGHALDWVPSSLTFLICKWLVRCNHKFTVGTWRKFGNVLNTLQRLCHYSIFSEAIWDPECDWKACLSSASSICCCGRGGGGWTPLYMSCIWQKGVIMIMESTAAKTLKVIILYLLFSRIFFLKKAWLGGKGSLLPNRGILCCHSCPAEKGWAAITFVHNLKNWSMWQLRVRFAETLSCVRKCLAKYCHVYLDFFQWLDNALNPITSIS